MSSSSSRKSDSLAQPKELRFFPSQRLKRMVYGPRDPPRWSVRGRTSRVVSGRTKPVVSGRSQSEVSGLGGHHRLPNRHSMPWAIKTQLTNHRPPESEGNSTLFQNSRSLEESEKDKAEEDSTLFQNSLGSSRGITKDDSLSKNSQKQLRFFPSQRLKRMVYGPRDPPRWSVRGRTPRVVRGRTKPVVSDSGGHQRLPNRHSMPGCGPWAIKTQLTNHRPPMAERNSTLFQNSHSLEESQENKTEGNSTLFQNSHSLEESEEDKTEEDSTLFQNFHSLEESEEDKAERNSTLFQNSNLLEESEEDKTEEDSTLFQNFHSLEESKQDKAEGNSTLFQNSLGHPSREDSDEDSVEILRVVPPRDRRGRTTTTTLLSRIKVEDSSDDTI